MTEPKGEVGEAKAMTDALNTWRNVIEPSEKVYRVAERRGCCNILTKYDSFHGHFSQKLFLGKF